MINSDINEKNILEKEYEEKYLGKFVEYHNYRTKGDIKDSTTYFKVSYVEVEINLVEFEEGKMLQAKIKLGCKNYIRVYNKTKINEVKVVSISYRTDKEDLYYICEELSINIDRFVKIIDKQTFKNILKTEVNNIIHTL